MVDISRSVFVPAFGDRDVDDLRQNSSALFPPEFYLGFLVNETIKALIGATVRSRFLPITLPSVVGPFVPLI